MHNRRKTRFSVIFSVVVLSCLCSFASGGMYRWVDEHGVIVYSQTPPASGDAVQIKPHPGPRASDQEAAQERLESVTGKPSAPDDRQTPGGEDKKQKAQENARRAENCSAARQNLETLKNLGNRLVRMPDGRYVRLSEDQVETKINEAQQQIDSNCK